MAKKEGEDKLAAWKATAPENLPAPVVVTREGAQTVPAPLLDAVLQADTSTLPVWLGADLGTQGYAVVKINKVMPRNPSPKEVAEQERKQYAQWVAGAENQAYYKMLSQRYKAQFKVTRPASPAAGQPKAVE
jgi:peptidyl-prolyl cis-trans isomerase D